VLLLGVALSAELTLLLGVELLEVPEFFELLIPMLKLHEATSAPQQATKAATDNPNKNCLTFFN
jgi:hypothetical protein